MPSETYELFVRAMKERKQIWCDYDGLSRAICPSILGHSKDGEEKTLAYQFSGESTNGLPPGGQWKCFTLSKIRNAQLRDGDWHTGSEHSRRQVCIKNVDLDINPDSPYRPRRKL